MAAEEKLAEPAMMVAIAVPWPLSSSGYASPLTKSHPGANCVASNAGARAYMPDQCAR